MVSSMEIDFSLAVRRIGSTWSGVRSLPNTSTCSKSVPSEGLAPVAGEGPRLRGTGGTAGLGGFTSGNRSYYRSFRDLSLQAGDSGAAGPPWRHSEADDAAHHCTRGGERHFTVRASAAP